MHHAVLSQKPLIDINLIFQPRNYPKVIATAVKANLVHKHNRSLSNLKIIKAMWNHPNREQNKEEN